MEHSLRSHAALRSLLYTKFSSELGIERELLRHELPDEDFTPLRKIPTPFDNTTIADTIIINAAGLPLQNNDYANGEIALREGKIQAIGKQNELAYLRGDSTIIIDAKGRTVLPAFADSHLHLLVGAERIYGCDLEGCKSFDELQQRIRTFASANQDLPVLHAYGLAYLTPPLLPAENARKLLDAILPEKPLFIYAHDLHTGWANTLAIKEAGMFEKMPPWPPLLSMLDMEGSITVDDEGLPAGEFREPEAYFLVEGALRAKHPLSPEQKLEALCRIFTKMHAVGITSVHSMGLALPEEDIEQILLLLELEQTNKLGLRVSASMSVVPDENMLGDVRRAAKIRDLLRDGRSGKLSYDELHSRLVDMLENASNPRQHNIPKKYHNSILGNMIHKLSDHMHAVHSAGHCKRRDKVLKNNKGKLLSPQGLVECNTIKIFLDGVVEKDTAYRSDQAPSPGIPAFSRDILEEVVCLADRAGLQVAAHCIGDNAVSMLLDAVAVARKNNQDIDHKRGHRIRHRVEHIELCHPTDLPRFASLGVTTSMQPLHERPPTQLWHRKVNKNRWATAFGWKLFLENGANLAFGSDWPIVPANCLRGIERAVTRTPWTDDLPSASLTIKQSIDAFTSGSAYAVHEEITRGRIAPGMFADLIFVDIPRNGSKEQMISKPQVSCTLMNGKVVYNYDD